MTPEEFYQQLSQQGFDLSDKQKQQFETYFHLLVEWNQKINLTAITEKEDVYLKHFYDSVAPVLQGNITNQAIRLLDIGAGAGFPSIPIKILCPEIDVTIIDSLNKRIQFLNLLAEALCVLIFPMVVLLQYKYPICLSGMSSAVTAKPLRFPPAPSASDAPLPKRVSPAK